MGRGGSCGTRLGKPAMKILLFVLPTPRHLYTANLIARALPVEAVVRQFRPERPALCVSAAETAAQARYIMDRDAAERRHLGPAARELQLPGKGVTFDVHGSTLDSPDLERFVRDLAPTILITLGCYGVGPALRRRASHALDFHLGMAPRYRGAGGLFWPIYNMDPERLGVTILQIDDALDGGAVAHHSRPTLSLDDTVHDMACKAIMAGAQDFLRILKRLADAAGLVTSPQRGAGRVYYESAYHPRHLQVIEHVLQHGLIADYLANKAERDNAIARVCYPGLD